MLRKFIAKNRSAAGLVEQYLGYALEKLPDSPMTNFSYGLFMLREADFTRAEEYFNKAYQANGIFQPAYCMLKYLERAGGKDEKKLIKEIEREIADYKEVYPLIFTYLGILYRKIGEEERAERYMKKGREQDPRLKETGDDLDLNYLELTYKLWTEDRIYRNRPVNAAYDRDRQICEEINTRMFSAGLL